MAGMGGSTHTGERFGLAPSLLSEQQNTPQMTKVQAELTPPSLAPITRIRLGITSRSIDSLTTTKIGSSTDYVLQTEAFMMGAWLLEGLCFPGRLRGVLYSTLCIKYVFFALEFQSQSMITTSINLTAQLLKLVFRAWLISRCDRQPSMTTT